MPPSAALRTVEETRRRRVVALIRVSTAEQAHEDRGGIPRQRRVIEQTIAEKDLDCLKIYQISDVSGSDVRANSEVQEILQLVATKMVSGVVLADLDRLFRPTEPSDYAILQVFKDTGAILFCGLTEYKLNDKDSALFANVRSAISGWELALMRERQQGAIETKRKVGKAPTGPQTWSRGASFDRKTQKWFWNEKSADVVALFEAFDNGEHNFRELGRRLGVSGQTVRNILSNRLYSTGDRIIDYKCGEKRVSASGRTYRGKVRRDPEDVIQVHILDPIVDGARFERVQRIMETVHYNHLKARAEDVACNLGTGLAFCAYCNAPLYCASGKKSEGRRYGLYFCRSNHFRHREATGGCQQPNLRQPALDELLLAFALKMLGDATTLKNLIEDSIRRTEEIVRPFPLAVDPDAQLQSLRGKDKRLVDAFEEGLISMDELRGRRENLRRQIAELREREASPPAGPKLDPEELAKRIVLRGISRLKRTRDRYQQKSLLTNLLSAVWLKGHSIVAFKLGEEFHCSESVPGIDAINGAVQLQEPFRLTAEPDPVPAGQRRCSRCKSAQPIENFYPKRAKCKACISALFKIGYKRRKAAKIVLSRAASELP